MVFMTIFSKKKNTNRICNIILKAVNASVFIVSTNSVTVV